MFSRKNLIRIAVNTLLGLALVLFWLGITDTGEVLDKIKNVNFLTLLPFILFFAVSNLLRSLRLKLLLHQYNIPLKNVILLNYLSQIFSYIIPLRAGEISKGVYLSTQYKIHFSKSLIWVLLDRFLDFWMVLILVLLLLLAVPTNLPENLKLTVTILFAPATLISLFVIFYPTYAKKIIKLFSYLLVLNVFKRLLVRSTDFIIDTISFLKRDVLGMTVFLFLTLGALISDGLGWYVFFAAVFQDTQFPTVLLGSLLSALTYLIPAAPGYVGSAEASGLAVFSFGLGLDRTLTSVAVVLNHAFTLFCILVFGITALYLLKFDTSLVWKKFRKG